MITKIKKIINKSPDSNSLDISDDENNEDITDDKKDINNRNDIDNIAEKIMIYRMKKKMNA